MPYPRFLRLKQNFPRPRVDNIPQAVRTALEKLRLGGTIKSGQTVALTAGSRGIANIPVVLKAVAQHLRDLGARPFLVPTMGSHGGGTAEGQRQVLESYGITEAFDPAGEEFGTARLEAALEATRGQGAASLVEHVLAATTDFAAGAEQSDDITLMALVYQG